MQAVVEGPEFTPPPEGGFLRSLSFAVVAHLLLLLALSLSVQWKRDDTRIAVEAEIWAPTPQQAAPKPVEAPPPPAPPPVVEKPVVQPPTPPVRSEADIALEREQAQEKARQEEAERQRRIAAERKRQDDLARQEQARQEQAKADERKREEQAKKADERKREEQAKQRRQKQEEERVAKVHEEALRRMQSQADATGLPSATGNATRSAGPSDSYAGRIRGRVKPNIVFTDDIPGNPTAIVEVRLAPDGTIIGKRITKSSGVRSWDDAVLRALDRTEVLPRDVDGRVHTPMELVFRPRD